MTVGEKIGFSQEEPKENYFFQYSATELKEVFNKSSAPILKRIIFFSAASLILFISILCTKAPDLLMGIVLGFFLAGLILHIRSYFSYKNAWKNSESRLLESAYTYELFDTYFILKISKKEEITKTFKIYFSEIEEMQLLGNFLILQIAGQSFIIKKDSIAKDSLFFTCLKNVSDKKERPKAKGVHKAISIILFVCSIATIWGALAGVAILSGMNHLFVENMWVFFLFTPIPIASVLFGVYLKKKGYKYKKNVIVGIIMTVLLCVYGSFIFMTAGLM